MFSKKTKMHPTLVAYLISAISLFIVLQWGPKFLSSVVNYTTTTGVQYYVILGFMAALVDLVIAKLVLDGSLKNMLMNFVIMFVIYSIVFMVQSQVLADISTIVSSDQSLINNIVLSLGGALLYLALGCLSSQVF